VIALDRATPSGACSCWWGVGSSSRVAERRAPSPGALAGRTAGSPLLGYGGATGAGGAGELPDGASVTGDTSGSVLGGGVGGMTDADGPGVGGSIVDAGAGGAGGSTKDGGSSACGDPGFACCSSNKCNAGGCCVSGICMAPGGICVAWAGVRATPAPAEPAVPQACPAVAHTRTPVACSAAGTTCRGGFRTKCERVHRRLHQATIRSSLRRN